MKQLCCKKCHKLFDSVIYVNNVRRNLSSRVHCLDCVPFNTNNRAKVYDRLPVCMCCGKQLTNQQKMFCSNNCHKQYQYEQYIIRWKQGLETGLRGEYQISHYVRRYLYEKYHSKCSRCGWGEANPYTGNISLEVHHNDGDYTNNNEDNLELLCPNCHSLTATYKSLNSNGRKSRIKYR